MEESLSIQLLRKEIQELKQMVAALIPPSEDDALTVKEACKFLNISRSTLMRGVANKTIPFTRPSGKARGSLRFSRQSLMAVNTPKQRKRRGRKTMEVSAI